MLVNQCQQEVVTMSAQEEVRRVTDQISSAAAKGDFGPFIAALDDDLEVFDTVAYRFDNKNSFLEFLQSAMAGAESSTLAFHQPSYRAVTDTAAVVNAYDRVTTTPKGGGAPKVLYGRTTLILVKRGSEWKIVSAHFSALPKE
jgi:ketosteroid isomerase-like protein